MAKDFFVDLTQHRPEREDRHERPAPEERAEPGERTIRNVMVNRRAPGPRHIEARVPAPSRKRYPMKALWLVAGVIVLSLLGVGIMLARASSQVTVTPRIHTINFDDTAVFRADQGGPGLTYTVETVSLEEFMTVPAQGTERVEDRATGNITVYNEYSDAPVRLIKNTRFETPAGLIYRIPASVVVPGKKGSTPGEVSVTVIADAAGPGYNSGPIDKLTVPGLKTTAAMYAGVYARAPQGMSGGFVGERPAVPADALESARVALRTALETKLRAAPIEREDAFVAAGLGDITFEHLPVSTDPSGAKVGERLIARVPVLPKAAFAAAIAQAVSADAGSSTVTLRPGVGYGLERVGSSTPSLAAQLEFRLQGSATLVWDVDTESLRNALLGKEKDAFKPIIAQFPGVERADADVAPVWSSRFPSDPDKLRISVIEPPSAP